MIGVQDLRKGTTFIDDDGNLYKVLEYQHVKQGRGNATIKTKLRNIKTGSTIDKNFQSGGRVQYVERSFTDPLPACDAVAACIALHHVKDLAVKKNSPLR